MKTFAIRHSPVTPDQSALALRQAVQKKLAVAFRADARVKDHDLAGIGAAADQAAETLFEFDDRFGQ